MIVTIIVIIILAAVVILTLSKNNPIESAREAAFKEDVRGFQDELAMYVAKDYTNKAGQRDNKINADKYTTDGAVDSVYTYIPSFNKKYENKFVIKNDELMYKDDNLTAKELEWVESIKITGIENPVRKEWRTYIADEVDGVPIPKGFTHVAGTTKEAGLVIEDGSHNEFVWIPSNDTEYKKDTDFSGTTPTGDDTILSGLDETLDVKKYGGFYIGRYEATIPEGAASPTNTTGVPSCKSGRTVWTNIDYTNSKASAESMYTGTDSSVQSGLLTGAAWDRTCHWVEDYVKTINSKSSLSDSRYYGNYVNSEFPANVTESGEKQTAGKKDEWKTKNIYDLAGNVWEWTYELSSSSGNVFRGGGYSNDGENISVLFRSGLGSDASGDYLGFRIRLYIKTE